VLQALIKPNETVYWLTRSNAAENRAWLIQQTYLNIIMTIAIKSFLGQLSLPTNNWPLSLLVTLPAVELAGQAQTKLDLMR
jgi:hypothetical protein